MSFVVITSALALTSAISTVLLFAGLPFWWAILSGMVLGNLMILVIVTVVVAYSNHVWRGIWDAHDRKMSEHFDTREGL